MKITSVSVRSPEVNITNYNSAIWMNCKRNTTYLLHKTKSFAKENAELKSLLCAHGIEYKPRPAKVIDSIYSPVSLPVIKLSIDERVALFMSLFKGREDVFARRWFSKSTGKAGYQPVCVNEWR